MKKWMPVFVVLAIYSSIALADGGPSYDHIVTTDVLITNLDQYPNIVLLAYTDDGYDDSVYVVSQNQSLPQGGYSSGAGARNLLAINKSVLEAEGGVDAIDLDVLKQKYTPAVVIGLAYEYIYDSNPLVSKTYRYTITGVTADKVSLKLYQGVFTFNDGRKSEVVYY
jgi:hypothetical protein